MKLLFCQMMSEWFNISNFRWFRYKRKPTYTHTTYTHICTCHTYMFNMHTHVHMEDNCQKFWMVITGNWKLFSFFLNLYFLEWMCMTFSVRAGERKVFQMLQRQNLSLWGGVGLRALSTLFVSRRLEDFWSLISRVL